MLGRPVALAGIGMQLGRTVGTPVALADMAAAACRAALSDAGTTAKQVDGIFEYRFGHDSPDSVTIQRLLSIPNLQMFSDIENTGPGSISGVLAAVTAVASGVCDVALTFRCISKSAGNHVSGAFAGQRPPAGRGPSVEQFLTPYGEGRADNILIPIALRKQRRIAEYPGGSEQYGYITINARRWGSLNPNAALPDHITMDEYLEARKIVDPLVLLDCDYPIDGACAVLVTTVERARDLRQPVVEVDSFAFGTGQNPDWTFADDFLFGGTVPCAQALWRRSSFTPEDLDVAGIYDGFTHITISWIEALGLCGIGEFSDWVQRGATIGPGGALPLNTSGGQLSEGRLHGGGLLLECIRQLRNQAGPSQVPGAWNAVVTNGFGPQCGAMTLIRGR